MKGSESLEEGRVRVSRGLCFSGQGSRIGKAFGFGLFPLVLWVALGQRGTVGALVIVSGSVF